MATSDFLPFATGSGANLETLSTYQGDSRRTNGEQPGQANSARFNRAMRQGTLGVAGLAQFCVDRGVSMPDDGDVEGFATRLLQALQAQGDPRYLLKAGDTATGPIKIASANAADALSSFLTLAPIDYAAGKPGLFLEKLAGAAGWRLVVQDPTGLVGTLDLSGGSVTAPTVNRSDASQQVASTAFTKAVGPRSNGYVSQNVPTLGINSGVIGAYLNNTYQGAIWYLPDLASTELYGWFTVYASAGLTIQRSGSDGIISRGGIYPSIQLLPGQTAVIMVGPDYWRLVMDPNVQDAGLGVIGTPQTIGDGYGYLDFTFMAGAYRELSLIVEGSSNAAHAGAGLCFFDGSGGLSDSIAFLVINNADSNPYSIFGVASIKSVDRAHSIMTTASGFGPQLSPYVIGAFAGNQPVVAVRHTGGLAGLRVLANSGSLTAGTYTLLGR